MRESLEGEKEGEPLLDNEMFKGRVSYLGPKASYTHQAAEIYFPQDSWSLSPEITIRDVFTCVQNGTSTHGVVPFENSTNGSVLFTLDLFADRLKTHQDVVVCGEIYLDVHHCLVGHIRAASNPTTTIPLSTPEPTSPSSSGHCTPTPNLPNPSKPRSKPITSLSHIKTIYSHPQAWGQCDIFLSSYLKGIERQDVSSTSKAAEVVSQDTSHTTAAIASSLAASVHGLDILSRNIEDSPNNTTRFLVLARTEHSSSSSGTTHLTLSNPSSSTDSPSSDENHYKTLVSFTIDHLTPGALADALAVFRAHNLNLTSINTRPSLLAPWNYIFFVEFVGRKQPSGRGVVNEALADLENVVWEWRWLGSWRNMLGRGLSA